MGRRSTWSFRYPPGAIRSREQLRDLIIEARKERKAIRLYAVEQMGHVAEFYVTPKSRLSKPEYESGLCSGEAFYSVDGYRGCQSYGPGAKNRYYKYKLLCGSYSVGCMSNEHHRLFQNRQHAENYSRALKDDAEYVLSVKEHWARCDMIFGRMTW